LDYLTDSFSFTKDNKELFKRVLRLADSSNRNVEVTLWSDVATNFSSYIGAVLAFKNAKLGEFKGEKNLSIFGSTLIEYDPDIQEAQQLKKWYGSNKDNISTTSHSIGGSATQSGPSNKTTKIETLVDLQEQFASGDKKQVFIKVKATLNWISHDERTPLFYKAASDTNRKVVENTVNPGNGKRYVCEKTGQFYDSYEPRYILSCAISDISGSQFVTIFNDHAKMLLGVDAKIVENLKSNGSTDQLNNIFEEALFKRYIFLIKAAEDMYQDEMRLRCIVSSVEKINYSNESKKLIDEIFIMIS